MTVGSLFSGIGGFDLGLERAGMTVKWQVEIDPFCLRVLEKHWPHARRYEDVRDVGSHNLESVDLVCGGFPCQDISDNGKRAGIDGERSGLWREMFRVIGELRPRYVIVENVSGLLSLGLGRVLGDLAAIGYDAEWDSLSACAFGAPHMRDRVFVVAYPHVDDSGASWPYQAQAREPGSSLSRDREARRLSTWFAVEPAMGRMVYGVPGVVDRIRHYGNAVIPQITEFIGHQIMNAECRQTRRDPPGGEGR